MNLTSAPPQIILSNSKDKECGKYTSGSCLCIAINIAFAMWYKIKKILYDFFFSMFLYMCSVRDLSVLLKIEM